MLDDVPLNFAVFKGQPSDEDHPLIYQYSLPALRGELAPRDSFEVNIPWYQMDRNGAVQPGSYYVKLDAPKQIHFLIEGTKEKQKWNVSFPYGNTFSAIIK